MTPDLLQTIDQLQPVGLTDLVTLPTTVAAPVATGPEPPVTVELVRQLARRHQTEVVLAAQRALVRPASERSVARRQTSTLIVEAVGQLAATPSPVEWLPGTALPRSVATRRTGGTRGRELARHTELTTLLCQAVMPLSALLEAVNRLIADEAIEQSLVDDLLEAGVEAARLLRRYFPRIYQRHARRQPFTPVAAFALCLLFTNLVETHLFSAWWGDWWTACPYPARAFRRACRTWTMATVWSIHGREEATRLLDSLHASVPALWGLGTPEEVTSAADGGLTAWTIQRCLGDPETDDWRPDGELDAVVAAIEALVEPAVAMTAPDADLIDRLNRLAAPVPRLGDLVAYVGGMTNNPLADYSSGQIDEWFGGVYEPHPWHSRAAIREIAANFRQGARLYRAYVALTEAVGPEPRRAVDLATRILDARSASTQGSEDDGANDTDDHTNDATYDDTGADPRAA